MSFRAISCPSYHQHKWVIYLTMIFRYLLPIWEFSLCINRISWSALIIIISLFSPSLSVPLSFSSSPITSEIAVQEFKSFDTHRILLSARMEKGMTTMRLGRIRLSCKLLTHTLMFLKGRLRWTISVRNRTVDALKVDLHWFSLHYTYIKWNTHISPKYFKTGLQN